VISCNNTIRTVVFPSCLFGHWSFSFYTSHKTESRKLQPSILRLRTCSQTIVYEQWTDGSWNWVSTYRLTSSQTETSPDSYSQIFPLRQIFTDKTMCHNWIARIQGCKWLYRIRYMLQICRKHLENFQYILKWNYCNADSWNRSYMYCCHDVLKAFAIATSKLSKN
jgi:hypothetical protein